MTPIVGIDLGTTNSLVAHYQDGAPRLIPNALGEFLTPSVVGIDTGGELLVGRAAAELQVVHPERCASLFKRHMGTDWTGTLDGKPFDAVRLSSLVLKSLRQDAEAHLGQPIERAVITVPAYFNEAQRQATLRAGRLAGLKVERILNEPTAAAIAYGLHEAEDEQVLLVYDLGGGTFDVSLVERFEGTLEIRASSGETFLGGEDFTAALAARVLERRGLLYERAEHEQPRMVARLRKECESAKRQLARNESAIVRPVNEAGEVVEGEGLTVTRAEFDEWTARVLARTELPLRRVLGDAGLRRADVDDVILVGGATRMPQVRRQVRELFGREPRCAINPDEVVALGAAVQAALTAREASLEEFVVTDVAPFTLGVETTHELGGVRRDGYFLPVINRNTTIPVSRVERLGTVTSNQRRMTLRIFQGESRRVEDNLFLGEFVVADIPLGPPGQEVDVRFTYDLNGLLEVEATVVETKRRVTHVITKYAQGLAEADVERAVREMQALKTHPREEARNRYLLRWAERLYRELPLFDRQALEELLRGFEAALELGEPAALDKHRETLEHFLSARDEPQDDHDRDDW